MNNYDYEQLLRINRNDINNTIDNNNNDNNNEILNLIQLIRIYFFQKDLQNIINLPHGQIKDKKMYTNYIISKTLIDKYKALFNYGLLYEFLNNYIKNNEINYANFEAHYPKIVSSLIELKREYYDFIINNEKTFITNNKFTENDYKLNFLQYSEKKTIFYLDDIEIVNNDIILFFNKSNIIINKKGNIIPCNYLGGDGKIFIFFNYMERNFYEIRTLDISTGNYIIEYLIEEVNQSFKDSILNNFRIFGIKNIIENIISKANKNEINFGNSTVAYFYKIQNQKQVEKTNSLKNSVISNNNEDNEFIFNIISFFASLYSFENDLQNKINTQNNQLNNSLYIKSVPEEYYLINGNALSLFKTNFSYKEFIKIINKKQLKIFNLENLINIMKNEGYFGLISSRKNDSYDWDFFLILHQLLI